MKAGYRSVRERVRRRRSTPVPPQNVQFSLHAKLLRDAWVAAEEANGRFTERAGDIKNRFEGIDNFITRSRIDPKAPFRVDQFQAEQLAGLRLRHQQLEALGRERYDRLVGGMKLLCDSFNHLLRFDAQLQQSSFERKGL